MTLELYIQERAEKAVKEAREEGREVGREEGRFDMVKNLLKVKTPIDYIVAATGWSKEKIAQLSEEFKH